MEGTVTYKAGREAHGGAAELCRDAAAIGVCALRWRSMADQIDPRNLEVCFSIRTGSRVRYCGVDDGS